MRKTVFLASLAVMTVSAFGIFQHPPIDRGNGGHLSPNMRELPNRNLGNAQPMTPRSPSNSNEKRKRPEESNFDQNKRQKNLNGESSSNSNAMTLNNQNLVFVNGDSNELLLSDLCNMMRNIQNEVTNLRNVVGNHPIVNGGSNGPSSDLHKMIFDNPDLLPVETNLVQPSGAKALTPNPSQIVFNKNQRIVRLKNSLAWIKDYLDGKLNNADEATKKMFLDMVFSEDNHNSLGKTFQLESENHLWQEYIKELVKILEKNEEKITSWPVLYDKVEGLKQLEQRSKNFVSDVEKILEVANNSSTSSNLIEKIKKLKQQSESVVSKLGEALGVPIANDPNFVDVLINETKELKQQKEEADQQSRNLKLQLESIQEKSDEQKREIDSLKKGKEEANQQIEELKLQLKSMQEKYDGQNRELSNAKIEIGTLTKKSEFDDWRIIGFLDAQVRSFNLSKAVVKEDSATKQDIVGYLEELNNSEYMVGVFRTMESKLIDFWNNVVVRAKKNAITKLPEPSSNFTPRHSLLENLFTGRQKFKDLRNESDRNLRDVFFSKPVVAVKDRIAIANRERETLKFSINRKIQKISEYREDQDVKNYLRPHMNQRSFADVVYDHIDRGYKANLLRNVYKYDRNRVFNSKNNRKQA